MALPRVYHVTLVLQLKGTDVKANDRATILQKWVVAFMADPATCAPCRLCTSCLRKHAGPRSSLLCAVQGTGHSGC